MSDYMFMLESHLSADQNRAVEQVQAAAGAAGLNLFLTGGAMRDMLGGFQIRDLDFSVEGNALKVAHALGENPGVRTVSVDEYRRTTELVFPGGVTAQVGRLRCEHYPKAGAKPQVSPATIREDLLGRDFTVNAMALSLSRASRGLLLDPANGLADLERHELRSTHSSVFYDDPVRMLRLVRLRVRLNFSVEEKTRNQYDSACAQHFETRISPHSLFQELKQIAEEQAVSEVVRALAEDGLLSLFSPALAGPKLNQASLAKMEKAERMLDSANSLDGARLGPFLLTLTAKLSPKEKSAFIKAMEIPRSETERWRTLEARSRKLEQGIKSPRLRKPSQVYEVLSDAPHDEMVYLLCNSAQRIVQERIRNYVQKYLPVMQEVPQSEWDALEGRPGTPKYVKSRHALVAARLDVRPPKPPEPDVEIPVEAVARGRARV